jgi:hypothetical protein
MWDVLKHQIIDSLHNSPIGGHSGIVATYQRVKKRFYCLKKEVETFLHECAVCQRVKGEHCHYPGLLDPLPLPNSNT